MRRSSRLFAAAGAAVVLGGCVSTQDIETIQTQLSELERQILQLQRQTSSKEEVAELDRSIREQTGALLKSEADVQVAVEGLSGEIASFEAKLEDTNYRLGQLSQQIAATNQQLQTFRSPTAPPAGEAAPGPPPAAVAADPQTLYQSAYSDFLRGGYDLAVVGFQRYLEAYPGTELADNAAYWIGECYFSQGKFRQAVREFDGLLDRYPRSDKTASALLKKAYALIELGDRAQAQLQLRRVIREFPHTDEADLARQRLDSLS